MTADTSSPATGVPRWTRLAAAGLLMASIGPLLTFLAGTFFGFEIVGGLFLLVPAIIGLAATYVVLRYGRRAKIVGAVVGFLIGGFLSFTVLGLGTPSSFFDFVPGMLVVPGGLIALVAGIGAAVASGRGSVSERPIGVERAWIRGLVYVIVAGTVVSGVLTATGRSSADESKASTSIIANEFKWNDVSYTVAGASSVFVRNDDPFLHTFTVKALGIDQTLTPGDEFLITIPARAGTYVLYCKPHTSKPEKPNIRKHNSESGGDMAARLNVT